MKVFISWSGERSQELAQSLREWLPQVLQTVEPFVSSTDLEKGSRWPIELDAHLRANAYGLLCLTRDNLSAPWLLFEAGVLSTSLSKPRVAPVLLDVNPADVGWPLAQFQATRLEADDVLKLIKSINSSNDTLKLDERSLEKSFEKWWPELQSEFGRIRAIPATKTKQTTISGQSVREGERSERVLIEELLELARERNRLDEAREVRLLERVEKTVLEAARKPSKDTVYALERLVQLMQHQNRILQVAKECSEIPTVSTVKDATDALGQIRYSASEALEEARKIRAHLNAL